MNKKRFLDRLKGIIEKYENPISVVYKDNTLGYLYKNGESVKMGVLNSNKNGLNWANGPVDVFDWDNENIKLANSNDFERLKVDKEGHLIFGESSLKVTKDNIADYYEFMSDEDLHNYKVQLSELLEDRLGKIWVNLGFKSDFPDVSPPIMPYDFSNYLQGVYAVMGTSKMPYQIIFGAKDTLKPIDEYIQDIKASNEYQEYILIKAISDYTKEDIGKIKNMYLDNTDKEEVENFRSDLSYNKEYELLELFDNYIQNNSSDLSPTVDECLAKVEEKEAAKSSVKTPSL